MNPLTGDGQLQVTRSVARYVRSQQLQRFVTLQTKASAFLPVALRKGWASIGSE